ncbi:MAG: DUF1573 domain-containing protein [Chitinispirillia bacterium]|nr:DUF1573 domain-containing protein [Chitinispirillia bacterium]
MRYKTFAMILLTAGLTAVFAAPKIEVNNATFSGGEIAENSKVEAVFRLTNTGTKPLRITNVRPDCGCTVAAYDTLIAPGKTSVFKPVVDVRGMRPGLMRRGITVTSDAANSPTLRLMIEASIIPYIEVSENHLTFTSAAPGTITLSSAKKDLNVTGIVFNPQNSGNVANWAANVPFNVNYQFGASDSTRADGLKVYRLVITPPTINGEPMNGRFVITTNHPDRKEISIQGRVQ